MLLPRVRPLAPLVTIVLATSAAGPARSDDPSPVPPAATTAGREAQDRGSTFEPPPGIPEPADPPQTEEPAPRSTEGAPPSETGGTEPGSAPAGTPQEGAPATGQSPETEAPPSAEESAPSKPKEPEEQKPKEPEAQKPKEGLAPVKEESWLDVGHAFIEQRIFAPVLRLDRFFSDERELEPQRARSFLRWRSEVAIDVETGEPKFTTGLRANLRLPGLQKKLERLRVIIEGQTRDTIAALFPTEPGATTPPPEVPIGTANAELRVRFFETLVTHGDVGAGVLFQLPPGAFLRTRLRFVVPIKTVYLTRYLATAFWRTDTHLGTSLAAEVERPLGPTVVTRLGGSGTVTQRSHGVEWNGELATLALLHYRLATQVGLAVNGATGATPTLDRWRLYVRVRRDFYRRWLFFELEPAVWWPWTQEQGRHTVWGMAARLEVQFQGNERPVSPPT